MVEFKRIIKAITPPVAYNFAHRAKKMMAKFNVNITENETKLAKTEEIIKIPLNYLLERCNGRKVIIYGTGSTSRPIIEFLAEHNIHVDYFIEETASDVLFEGKIVRSYLDVVYEETDSSFIIITNEKESYGVSRQRFIGLGLTEHLDFTYYKEIGAYGDVSCDLLYDVILSYNRVRENLEGFEIIEGCTIDGVKPLRIVALGGSTTESGIHYVKSWPRYLADLFASNGIPVEVYCGGVSGYTSSQELLKLIRDVLPLKPDMVLSYSGYNDFWYHPHPERVTIYEERENKPFITLFQVQFMRDVLSKFPEGSRKVFYGLENNKTASELWIDNTRNMYAIAKEHNILFLSFLQPFSVIGGYKISNSQKVIIDRCGWQPTKGHVDFMIVAVAETIDAIEQYDYITDLTQIFADQENIYYDFCHVNERGNKIIAKHVYQELSKHLEEGKVKW